MADPHLDLSEYNGAALVATSIAFLALSWTSVILRGYVRIFMTNGLQPDDWLMIVAQLNFTVSCTFILLGVGRGLGRHNQALDQATEIDSLKWQALATATYIINMMFIKLSIGIFLLRLAVQKVYRYILWASLVIITIWSLVLFFWNIFQCKPVEAQWDYAMIGGECVSITEVVAAAYALSVMTILSDWLYALLPIPMLWKVDMTRQAKLTVILILGLGIFASIATLIRLKFLADLEQTDDILFAGTDAMVWTLVEPGVAIVAASLATIRPLLRAMRIRGFDSTGRSGAKSGGVRSGTSRSTPGVGSTLDRIENQYLGRNDGTVELDHFRVADGPGPDIKTHVRNYSRPQGIRRAPEAQEEGRGPNFDKNELYVVDTRQQRRGSDFGTAYGYDEGDTSLSSFDLGHDAESQHSGRVGLGPGGF
ncbi:related to integral membrane protein pth11 [Cephalotrichum gorgonifer]|uniref:Related to integral membrane protein pth11 n=1 Tax=Cephalotrichum gorgonifer TaxID=2041049 RepID=A0AAE8MU16_9PEZI|nr:related to integral membrane protein pth11 [Cephalotrichum gorgonifer]